MNNEKQVAQVVEDINKYLSKKKTTVVINTTLGGKHKQDVAEYLVKNGYRKVVMCKDCKYCDIDEESGKAWCNLYSGANYTIPIGYCNYGKRRK